MTAASRPVARLRLPKTFDPSLFSVAEKNPMFLWGRSLDAFFLLPAAPNSSHANSVERQKDCMRSAKTGCFFLLALSLSVAAQNPLYDAASGDESGRILALENAWNQAESNHAPKALSLLLADTFAYTDDDGSVMNRSQWLAHVKSEVGRYGQLGNTGMKIQFYGDTAIVTGDYHEKMNINGKPVAYSGRFTDTWIRQNGQWKCVASQATLHSH
jgi:ketosteroid isomerase-like protein